MQSHQTLPSPSTGKCDAISRNSGESQLIGPEKVRPNVRAFLAKRLQFPYYAKRLAAENGSSPSALSEKLA
jgi:hypothetical protein